MLLVTFHRLLLLFFNIHSDDRLSETLAAAPDYTTNRVVGEELVTVLKLLLRCNKNKVYTSPKLNYDYLRQLIVALPRGFEAAVSATG